MNDRELLARKGHEVNDDLPPLPEPARWYCVNRDGVATLCVDEADARKEAAYANESWPRHAPYRAVQIVPADEMRAAAEEARRVLSMPLLMKGDAPVVKALKMLDEALGKQDGDRHE